MFVKVFKALSLSIIIAIFIVVITSRTLQIKKHTPTLLPKNIKEKTFTPPQNEIEPVHSTALQEKTNQPETDTLDREQSPVSPVAPSAITTYENLTHGTSDTDETYTLAQSPCSATIGFKIGTFDTRFGITKEAFIDTVEEAAALWGAVAGAKLFYYDEDGPLTVNLIYDKRQEDTDTLNYLALDIENAKTNAENLRIEYQKDKDTYERAGLQFTKDAEDFNARYKTYSEKVAAYNKDGGAPQAEYSAMMDVVEKLKQEASMLDIRQTELNKQMESINIRVAKYNEFVAYINSLIRKSNALGTQKFTEGRFSPGTNTIDIYQYSNLTKLKRVVAHELGHALGINHTKTVHSIMYSVNMATSTTLSDEDKEALLTLCSQ